MDRIINNEMCVSSSLINLFFAKKTNKSLRHFFKSLESDKNNGIEQ